MQMPSGFLIDRVSTRDLQRSSHAAQESSIDSCFGRQSPDEPFIRSPQRLGHHLLRRGVPYEPDQKALRLHAHRPGCQRSLLLRVQPQVHRVRTLRAGAPTTVHVRYVIFASAIKLYRPAGNSDVTMPLRWRCCRDGAFVDVAQCLFLRARSGHTWCGKTRPCLQTTRWRIRLMALSKK